MADTASFLEYYKLAAQVIPVLWIGNVLQQLDPDAARRAVQPLNQRFSALQQRVAGFESPDAAPAQSLAAELAADQAELAAIMERFEDPAQKREDAQRDSARMGELLARRLAARDEILRRRAEMLEEIGKTSQLQQEVEELRTARGEVAKRYRPLALLAILALPVAVLSEVLSLYGVMAGRPSGWITFAVTAGLIFGGTLLVAPLFLGWVRLLLVRSWIR